MRQLLDHLNSLPKPEQVAFGRRCGTTVGYLRKAVSIGQKISAETCARIERETCGAVKRKNLRPDDWMTIWPELAEAQVATGATAHQPLEAINSEAREAFDA